MKRSFARYDQENQNHYSGFVPAANISHVDDHPSEIRNVNQCSRTWRTFFEQLHEEENTPPLFSTTNTRGNSESSLSAYDGCNAIEREQPRSYTSILSGLVGSSERDDSRLSQNGQTVIEDHVDAELYSVFTKKVMKSASTSESKPPAIVYSPPKFSNLSNARSISKPSSVGKQPLFCEPYALSTKSSERRLRALKSTSTTKAMQSIPAVPCLSNFGKLPEQLRDRPLLVYSVLYSPSSTRKHKKWENDGFLYFDFMENQIYLHKLLEKPAVARQPTPRINVEQIEEEYVSGYETYVEGFEVQIQDKYFSNVGTDIKDETRDEAENSAKRAQIEDERHFFDENMENYLMKTEEDGNGPVGFGLLAQSNVSQPSISHERIGRQQQGDADSTPSADIARPEHDFSHQEIKIEDESI